MKKIFTLIFALVSASQINVDATDGYGLSYQSLLPDFQKLTPEAAALGSHGNIEASEYTGQPNIQIPLYSVSVGDISVPIYLSYDASGIKVEQQASFVGLGWNLISGGCINRIICGQEDNLSGRSTYDFYRNHILGFLNINSEQQKVALGHGYIFYAALDSVGMMEDITHGYFQPDIYQASFCGHSVTFTVYHGDPLIIGDDATKYRITCIPEDSRVIPSGFRITDDQGCDYFFGVKNEGSGGYSYYLDSIASKDNRWVKFEYEQANQITTPITLFQSMGSAIDGCDIPQMITNQFISVKSQNSCSTTYKVYPSEIRTSKETVTFEYGADREDIVGVRKLNRVIVSSENGIGNTHVVSLGYDYFQEERRNEKLSMEILDHELGNYSAKRLKLTSVSIDAETYEFKYNPMPLPYNTSLSQDFWGYYNGMNNTNNFICTPKFVLKEEGLIEQPTIGNANRYCSPNAIRAGVLDSIVYPTGGFTKFTYEVNEFSDPEGYCYPSAESLIPYIRNTTNSVSSSNTYTMERVQLGVLSLFPADPATDGSYSEKIVDFEITGEEPEIERSHSIDRNGNDIISEYVNVDFLFRGQTRKTYHQKYPNSQTQYCLRVFLRFYGNTEAGGSYDYQYSTSQESENFEETIRLRLPKGQYHMYAKIEHIDNDRTAQAYMLASYPKRQPINPSVLDIDTSDNSAGPSIGAGLRISRIDNYDEHGAFAGGKKYKYKGGKLLVPTVKADKKLLDIVNPEAESAGRHRRAIFYYTSSQASYPTICSFGSPTVGYSEVVKEDLGKDGNVVRKTISTFHNEGYIFAKQSLMYNTSQYDYNPNYFYQEVNYGKFFYYPNEGLNGKMIQQVVKNHDDQLVSTTNYYYDSKRSRSILYSASEPTFIYDRLIAGYNYALYGYLKANVWTYMTKTISTSYVNGSPMVPVETVYSYNEDNYRQNLVNKTIGNQNLKYELFYPSDSVSFGFQYLLNKHILGECTMSKQYLNDRLVGGTEFNYTTHKGIPVISTSYQILPDTLIQEMEVTDYDDYGNIREYKTKDGIYTTIIWSYNHLYPVLQVVGTQYKDIKGYVTSLESAKTLSKATLVTAHSNISGVGGIVTAYLYDAWYGVSDIIAPNGKIAHYDRDSQGRLSAIRENDSNGPVIQSFFYKYLTQ